MPSKLEAFFTFIYGDATGYMCLAAINHRGDKQFKESFYKYPGEMDKAVEFVQANLIQDDMYYCPHLLSKARRVKENALPSLVVWSDLDYCPPDVLLIEPTFLIETSDRRSQGIWRLEQAEAPEVVEQINHKIAYYHAEDGADKSGWDLTQLLRVPLTKNHKYGDPPQDIVFLVSRPENKYSISSFNVYPDKRSDAIEMPDIPDVSAEDVLEKYTNDLSPLAEVLFEKEPDDDWSSALWGLEMALFEGGVSLIEVFIVAKAAACNKYARDGRSDEYLWKEVTRAFNFYREKSKSEYLPIDASSTKSAKFQDLLKDEDRKQVEGNDTFIEEYIKWASSLGDAASQYHQAGAFIVLSTLLAGQVRLPTSFGIVMPNLWFMILADTTLTRKSTAMDIAIDLINDVDPHAVLATDGSIEGLLTLLSTRPGRPSIFLRDEFTGLMSQMNKRDYYSGMLETLTKLYDGKMMKRVLRREEILVQDPCLILFAGGIKSKMMELLSPETVSSGFIPRFCIITAKADIAKIKPMGPPTTRTTGERDRMVAFLTTLYEKYHTVKAGRTLSNKWHAELTPDAWKLYNKFETLMVSDGYNSNTPELMTPVMNRLAESGLKASMLIAATRDEEKIVVTEDDLYRAFYYVEHWRMHSVYVVNNVGTTNVERLNERVMEMIEARPGISRGEIMRNLRLQAKDMAAVIETLTQRQLIRKEKSGRTESYSPLTS